MSAGKDLWFVMGYWESGAGEFRREYPVAVAETREAAANEAARIMLMEVKDEGLPHGERSRLFLKQFRVMVA